MKKRSYTFNFNTFKFICIFTSIAVLFFNLLSSQILKSFDNKYYKFFDDDNLDYKIILIGNSRTIKLQNYTDKEILNLSYNELNFEMVSFFLDVLKKKKNYENINLFIELTSLSEGSINCDFLIYDNLKYFENERFGKCKNFLHKFMLRLIKLNSEIFQRIVMESIFEKNEIARVSVSKEICNYKKKHPYDIYYSDDKKFLLELEKIKEINSDFKNVSFFILPYINGYNMTHKIEEQFRNNNIQHINLSKVLKKDFYLDCDNFWDVSHFNHNSASKIAQIIWPN